MRKHVRCLPLLALAAVPLALAGGCDTREAQPPEETAGAADPIVGGTIDTANDAVVAVLGANGSMCTGTIIAKNGSTGYVLSAGHCQSSSYYILQADDFADCIDGNSLDPSLPGCDEVYVSTGDLRHPDYTDDFEGQGFPAWDFLLIRFSGANASTPVIPADDGSASFAPGDLVEFSGYGLMNQGSELVETSQRRHVTNNIDEIYGTPPLIEYEQHWSGQGGPCSGDSGGPAIKNGYVVGVTSFGDGSCDTAGYSAYVAQEYGYIAGFIGEEVPPETCDQCVQGSVNGGQCAQTYDDCIDSAACYDLLLCFDGCTTDACYDGCADQHPGGIEGYNAIVTCAYCDACDATCNADFCDSGSTASSGPVGSGPVGSGPTTSVGVTTGTGDSSSATGDSATGVTTGGDGGASAAGDGDGDDDDDDDDDGDGDGGSNGGDSAEGDDGCTVGATGAPSGAAGWLMLAAAALASAGRRRR